jgi:hypothetical protein
MPVLGDLAGTLHECGGEMIMPTLRSRVGPEADEPKHDHKELEGRKAMGKLVAQV